MKEKEKKRDSRVLNAVLYLGNENFRDRFSS